MSCAALCRDRNSRTKNWLKSKDGITFFKRDGILEHLESRKKIPFTFYTTSTYKTQGFLYLMSRPNYSNDKYIVGHDREQIPVEQKWIAPMLDVIRKAREKKFTKSELSTGILHTHRWKDRTLCEKIIQLARKPMWRLLVFAV